VLRVGGPIDLVGDVLHVELDRLYPSDAGGTATSPDPNVIAAARSTASTTACALRPLSRSRRPPRLIVPSIDWDGFVRLAFDEIRLAGAASPQVTRRLRAALEDLKSVAPAVRQAALDRQLELLDAALVPDEQGIGSGPDVVTPDGRRDPDGRARAWRGR
jgi:hypothetical protein